MAKAEPNKNDVRYLATQERIEETFWDLLADGGFPKITVRALSERAGINRGTFYLHAEDKYDLLSQVEDRMHQGMMGGGARLASGDAPEGEASPMAAPMIAGARFAYENRERMLLLMDDTCDPLFFSKYAAKVKAAERSDPPTTLRRGSAMPWRLWRASSAASLASGCAGG